MLLTVHAGGMEDFATQEELQSYLQSLNKVYSARCAVRLWKHKVNTRSILANSSVEALMHAGVTEELHASNIKAKAGTSGEVETVLLAACLAKPNSDMHLVCNASHVCISCLHQQLWP